MKVDMKKKRGTEYSPPRLNAHTKAVERAIHTLKDLITGTSDDKISFTVSLSWALRLMRSTWHTKLKMKPIELHHSRKLRIELTSLVKCSTFFVFSIQSDKIKHFSGSKAHPHVREPKWEFGDVGTFSDGEKEKDPLFLDPKNAKVETGETV